jgi:hypothetical protein
MYLTGFWRRLVDVVIGVVIGFLMAWDIVFARSIDISKAGVTLWVFLAVGAFIILLQAIPAFILFTTLIAGLHKSIGVHDEEKEKEEELPSITTQKENL